MKKSKANQSVYRNQNSLIRALFERAGSARKVLCVALDYAKRKHVALICDGNGDVLKSSFPVENNTAGIEHLIKGFSATARHNLRLASALVKNEIPYLAPEGRGRHATPAQIETANQATWAILLKKWRTISGDPDLILDQVHPLGYWRKLMLEIHGIDLPGRL